MQTLSVTPGHLPRSWLSLLIFIKLDYFPMKWMQIIRENCSVFHMTISKVRLMICVVADR